MQIDARYDPTISKRKSVVDLSSGNEITDIAYADDETGVYAVWKRKNDYTNDIATDDNGNREVIEISRGSDAIRIVRR